MLASLVAPRFDFYLHFFNCQGGSNQSLVVLRPNVKGEEKHPNMASKQHTITAKSMGMVYACVCGHDNEKETLSMSKSRYAWHVHV